MKHLLIIIILLFSVSLFYQCSKDESSLMDESGKTFFTSDATASGTSDNSSSGDTQTQPGVITAAEWNDIDNWEFWNNLLQNNDYFKHLEYWELFPTRHINFSLKNQNDNAIIDAAVQLYNNNDELMWEAKTDNFGKAQLWLGLDNNNENPSYILINYKGISYKITDTNSPDINYKINTTSEIENNVEIMFVVDATGSMGDELEYLKTELLDVIEKAKTQNRNSNTRLGAVFYRDEGDSYVVRNFSLTNDINNIVQEVSNQHADGGGDYPEAVHTALNAAITQQSWKNEAVCRLLFLVLDAPPHYQSQVIDQIHNQIELAAKKGIKIIPVAASGINKETEFLLRIMAISTNGTYTFITNDSGIGNDHLEATVGQYEVEYLNDLLVRLISKYSQM